MTSNDLSPPSDRTNDYRPLPVLVALRRHATIIAALLRREALQRVQNPFESLLGLCEPLLLICVLTAAFAFFTRLPPYGSSTMLFLSTGFVPYYYFLYVSRRMRGSIESPRSRHTIEQTLDYIITHVILRTIDYAIVGPLFFTTIYLFVTPTAYPTDIVPILEALSALVILGLGLGLINIAANKVIPIWGYIYPSMWRCVMLFSGLHFIPDFQPPYVRNVLSFNPLLHAIALFRLGFYPHYPKTLLDRQYLFLFAFATLFVGLLVERVMRRRLEGK